MSSHSGVARKISPTVGVFGLALASWVAITGTPQQLRSSVTPVENDDIQIALQKNLTARSYAAWRKSGYTPKDIFEHVQALGSVEATQTLCRELSQLSVSQLVLFDQELSAHDQLPCATSLKKRLNQNWESFRIAAPQETESQSRKPGTKIVIGKQPQLAPGEVALFFEGEPSASITTEILNALNQRGVRAHFFIPGQSAQDAPSLIQKIAAAGHPVGSLSMYETDLTEMNLGEAQRRLLDGQTSIRLSTDLKTPFFRFPFDAASPELKAFAARNQIIPLNADIDSEDYRIHNPTLLVQNILRKLEKKKSGIILFRNHFAQTAIALPLLLAELEHNGFRDVVFVESLAARD